MPNAPRCPGCGNSGCPYPRLECGGEAFDEVFAEGDHRAEHYAMTGNPECWCTDA